MNSTFSRAVVGFVVLSSVVMLGAWILLSASAAYLPGNNWVPVLLVIVVAVVEVGIYSSTLHQPVYDWIREPELERIRAERAEYERRERDRTSAGVNVSAIGTQVG